MFRKLAGVWLLRRLLRELARMVAVQERQTELLSRLVDQLAPRPASREAVHADTGVSHLDEVEAGLALAYVDRIRAATGHIPDDDEILLHLADEKTIDLHARLTARDAELARLVEDRLR